MKRQDSKMVAAVFHMMWYLSTEELAERLGLLVKEGGALATANGEVVGVRTSINQFDIRTDLPEIRQRAQRFSFEVPFAFVGQSTRNLVRC